jgi:hypothetical protein
LLLDCSQKVFFFSPHGQTNAGDTHCGVCHFL